MALSKQQSYALYFFLTTNSQLVSNLKAANCPTREDFVTALQHEVNAIEQGPTVDKSLANLWTAYDATSKVTYFDTHPASILAALPAMADDYGGGPCPLAIEQKNIWNAIKGAMKNPVAA